MGTSLLAQALVYLQKGYSIIPVGFDKRPLISWKEYQIRQPNHEELISWWQLFPEAQIGIVTGAVSNLTVVDVEKDGDFNLIQDKTYTVKTGGGGRHYYFKHDPEFKNAVRVIPEVDVRSEGGYVVACPSESQKGVYSAMNTHEVTQMSHQTKTLLLGALKSKLDIFSRACPDSTSKTLVYEGANQGERNDSMTKLAGLIHAKIHQTLWESVGWKLFQEANQKNSPKLSEKELRTIWRSIETREMNQNPDGRVFKKVNPLTESSEKEDFRPTTTEEDFNDSLKVFLEGRKKGVPTGFKELDNIIGGLVPGQSYLIYADTSAGKSLLVVNLLVNLIKQGEKVCYFDLENSKDLSMERMMFATAQDLTLSQWHLALDTQDKPFIEKTFGVLKPLLDRFFLWDLTKLNDRFGEIMWGGVEKCIEEAVAEGCKVVVVDHLHYFNPAETDHSFLGDVSRRINNLVAMHNVVIIAVAHTKKGLSSVNKRTGSITATRPQIDSINGSSLISKHFKNILSIKRNVHAEGAFDRSETTVYVDKTKFGPTGKVPLVYDEQTLCFRSADGTLPPNLMAGADGRASQFDTHEELEMEQFPD